jgi:hypothetical protein
MMAFHLIWRYDAIGIAVACALIALVSPANALAQSPYPITPAPQVPVGGYIIPQPIPYQPTLVAPGQVGMPQGQAAWIGPPGAAAPVVEQSVVPVATPAFAPPGLWQTLPASGVQLPPDPTLPVPSSAMGPAPPAVPFPDQPSPSGKANIIPPGGRNGVFQKINFTGTYLPRLGEQNQGMTDLETQVVFGVPFFTVETPLVITPKYGFHALDGPVTPDVPPHVQDFALDLTHIRPFDEHWVGIFDVTFGEFADDHSFNTRDAFRVTGNGTAIYVFSPELKGVLGVAYVNRVNEQFLPIVGVDWKPSDDAEYQLVFPSTKLAWRLGSSPVPGQDEHWLYLAGDFGGGVWAVERTSGVEDKLDITDWRVSVGLEHKVIGGLSERVEIGYVFQRKIEYFSDHQEFHLGDTLLARVGVTY